MADYDIVSSLARKMKKVALNMSDIEIKVEEATSSEPWGPHGTLMTEISAAAYDWDKYRQIMGVIGRRLQSSGENWRHVYKSLILLDHMLKHGPTRIIQELESSMSVLERFHSFKYVDDKGKDQGVNIRHRSKELTALIRDKERVEAERAKAKALKSKYGGMSSTDARYGGGSSGGGPRRSTAYDDYESDLKLEGGSRGGRGSEGERDTRSGMKLAGAAGGSRTATDSKGYDPWLERSDSPAREQRGEQESEAERARKQAVEATRQRIQGLKQEGYLASEQEGSDAMASTEPAASHRATPLMKGNVQSSPKKGPRKLRLSDMKVDPKIAASLGGGQPIAVQPAAQLSVAPNPAPAQRQEPQADLLGGLLDDAPEVKQEGHVPGVGGDENGSSGAVVFGGLETAAPASGSDVWDAFAVERATSASVAAPQADAAFDAFQAVPSSSAQQPSDNLSALLSLDEMTSPPPPAPPAAASSAFEEGLFNAAPVGVNSMGGPSQGLTQMPTSLFNAAGMSVGAVPPHAGGMVSLPPGLVPMFAPQALGNATPAGFPLSHANVATPAVVGPSTGGMMGQAQPNPGYAPMRSGVQHPQPAPRQLDPFADLFK